MMTDDKMQPNASDRPERAMPEKAGSANTTAESSRRGGSIGWAAGVAGTEATVPHLDGMPPKAKPVHRLPDLSRIRESLMSAVPIWPVG